MTFSVVVTVILGVASIKTYALPPCPDLACVHRTVEGAIKSPLTTRVRVFLDGEYAELPSGVTIWPPITDWQPG